MKKTRKMSSAGLILTSLLAILLFSSCSQRSVNNEPLPSVSLSMKVTEPGLMQYVDQFRLIVTAPDMNRIDTPLTLEDGYLVGEVDVPAGDDRTFTALALDASSQDTIYRGDTTIDVTAGETIDLPISLYPQVRLIKLSPRFRAVDANTSFMLDVKVFNIDSLYGISFRIRYDGFLISPDSAVLSNTLPLDIIFLDAISPPYYAFAISNTDQSTPIVDTGGDAVLATVYFHSFYPEVDTDTAELTIEVTGLTKPNGDSIPVSSVYTDRCLVEVQPGSNPVVTFPDPMMEAAVRSHLNDFESDLLLSEVDTISRLFAVELGISDLSGLSNLSNLRLLNLEYNQITDISEIAHLKRLGQLFLGWNSIQDISPLAGQSQIIELGLQNNQITDIGPLYADYPDSNTLGLPTDSTDKVWLAGNPLSDTTQVNTLCSLNVWVELDGSGRNWCQPVF